MFLGFRGGNKSLVVGVFFRGFCLKTKERKIKSLVQYTFRPFRGHSLSSALSLGPQVWFPGGEWPWVQGCGYVWQDASDGSLASLLALHHAMLPQRTGKVDFRTGTGRKAFFDCFLGLILDPALPVRMLLQRKQANSFVPAILFPIAWPF